MTAHDVSDAPIDLSGRVAVVTGAAAGLGRAEAIGLARAGATVVVRPSDSYGVPSVKTAWFTLVKWLKA